MKIEAKYYIFFKMWLFVTSLLFSYRLLKLHMEDFFDLNFFNFSACLKICSLVSSHTHIHFIQFSSFGVSSQWKFICCWKLGQITKPCCDVRLGQRSSIFTTSHKPNLLGQPVHGLTADASRNWSFITGSRIAIKPKLASVDLSKNVHGVHASCK